MSHEPQEQSTEETINFAFKDTTKEHSLIMDPNTKYQIQCTYQISNHIVYFREMRHRLFKNFANKGINIFFPSDKKTHQESFVDLTPLFLKQFFSLSVFVFAIDNKGFSCVLLRTCSVSRSSVNATKYFDSRYESKQSDYLYGFEVFLNRIC